MRKLRSDSDSNTLSAGSHSWQPSEKCRTGPGALYVFPSLEANIRYKAEVEGARDGLGIFKISCSGLLSKNLVYCFPGFSEPW